MKITERDLIKLKLSHDSTVRRIMESYRVLNEAHHKIMNEFLDNENVTMKNLSDISFIATVKASQQLGHEWDHETLAQYHSILAEKDINTDPQPDPQITSDLT